MVQKFKSEVTLIKDGECFAASSILGVLSANLECGAAVEIEAIGPDAETALDRLEQLLEHFREQEARGLV